MNTTRMTPAQTVRALINHSAKHDVIVATPRTRTAARLFNAIKDAKWGEHLDGSIDVSGKDRYGRVWLVRLTDPTAEQWAL